MHLKEGKNCWRVGTVPRGSVLVDAEDFFRDIHRNFLKARHSIYILGWEFHHSARLLQGRSPRGTPPARLDALINYICRKRPELKIYILCWDFPAFFLVEREMFQDWKIKKQCSEQVRFVFDSQHPIGASHHQKIVVIDDSLAYCGGLDLTANRWDTRSHLPQDRRRKNPWGKPYPPLHDIQISVTGELAASLGHLARQRWLAATGERLSAPAAPVDASSFCFSGIGFEGRKAALARTFPAFKAAGEIKEIEALTLDLLDSAKEYVYLENQFFTCPRIAEKLQEISSRPGGPDVLLLLPKKYSAPWEKHMVGILQNRMVQDLSHGPNGRLKVYSPEDSRLDAGSHVQLHSKLMVVDGRQVFVGSANLTKRSMGVDSECNVLVADAPELARRLVASLIAEHTAQAESLVTNRIESGSRLFEVIEEMNLGSPKKLLPYETGEKPEPLQDFASNLELVDLERPILAEKIADRLVFDRGNLKVRKRMLWGYLFMLMMAVLAVSVLTEERPWTLRSPDELSRVLGELRTNEWRPLWVFGIYAVGAVLFIPINLLFVITAAIFPLGEAAAYIFGGGLLNSLVSYGLGRWLGRSALKRFFPRSVESVSRFLSKKPILAVTLIHFFPIAPFTVDNLALGALRIRTFPFLAGTLLGILPGALVILFFERSLAAALTSPNWKNWAIFYGLAFLLFWMFYYFKNRFLVLRDGTKLQDS